MVGQRLGTGVKRVHVAATNQRLGGKVGDHTTDEGNTGYKGETLYNRNAPTFDPVRYGNATAAELSGANAGCGKGRDVMRTGSQGVHGETSGKVASASRSGDVMSSRR